MEERVSHSPSAAASPFRFHVRDLVRRPGAQRDQSISLEVPSALGTEMIAVPEGAAADLSVRFEVVTDGIWVSGSLNTEAVGECSRCLEEVRLDVDATIQGLFLYPGADVDEEDDSDDVYEFDGEYIDLEDVVRDAVVTLMPFRPLCDPNCPGLCDQCGARLADDPGHAHEMLDPRWSALDSVKDLFGSDEKES